MRADAWSAIDHSLRVEVGNVPADRPVGVGPASPIFFLFSGKNDAMRILLLLALTSVPFLAQSQSIIDTWYRQGVYQVEEIRIDGRTFRSANLESVRVGEDSLSVLQQARRRDQRRLSIEQYAPINDTLGCLVVRLHPDSTRVNVVQYRLHQPGVIAFLPIEESFATVDDGIAAGTQIPQSYRWLQSRTYLSDSLINLLPTRPGLEEVTKTDVEKVLRQYNTLRSDIEALLTADAERTPSRFAVSSMLRSMMQRLFLAEAYNPYAEYRVHPFDKFKNDPQIKKLLENEPGRN